MYIIKLNFVVQILIKPTFSSRLLAEFSGDIYEHAVVLSVKAEDQDAFERFFFQLKPYYTETR